MKFPPILLGLLLLLVLGCIVLGLFYQGILRLNYPSTSNYPIQGIDVSHHQKDINWEQVHEQNIQFAFIKATEGGDFKDRKFMENWKRALAAGIDVGGYHFFTFCTSGREQAANFIATVPLNALALPPVIDVEFGGNCALTISEEAVLAELDTLQYLLEQKYQKRPIFYVTKAAYQQFLKGRFPAHGIWIRDIYGEPALEDREWLFWQYANRGNLKGIEGYVDLNVFGGNQEDYQLLLKEKEID